MGIFGIGSHGNERIVQGLDYENFRSLATSATDRFRSDDRGPGHKTLKRGFTSRNDLSVPANRTEAMGLGVMTDGKASGWVTFKGRHVVDIDGTNHSRLSSMQNRIDWDKDYTIKFNPDYRP